MTDERDMFGARKGEYAIPIGAREGHCLSCNAPVVWVMTKSGAAMPLSLATVEVRDGTRYGVTHFADCPQAKGWSKKK